MSRIDTGEEPTGIENDLPDAHLFQIEFVPSDLEETAQFLKEGCALEGTSDKKKNTMAMKATPYTIINIFLYKLGLDDVLR